MRSEPGASTLANMSAPPRSTVMLPRLVAGAPIEDNAAGDSAKSPWPTRDVPVGPGGGRRLSQALCLARVELRTAVCAHLRMLYSAPMLARPQGLARALVAIARHGTIGLDPGDAGDASEAGDPGDAGDVRDAGDKRASRARGRAARLELDRVGELPEGELVRELTSRLESVEWPRWVPRVGMVTPIGLDIAAGMQRQRPPKPPKGIVCPLLAARMVSAIRGPVFMRDAAPTLTHLLDLFCGTSTSWTWELWLPLRPGTVSPQAAAPSMTNHAMNREER